MPSVLVKASGTPIYDGSGVDGTVSQNLISKDAQGAGGALVSGNTGSWLLTQINATDAGTIPDNAVIGGVSVEAVQLGALATTPYTNFCSGGFSLNSGGTIHSRNQVMTGGVAWEDVVFGGVQDLMGVGSLSKSDITGAGFRLAWKHQINNNPSTQTYLVDRLWMRVHYSTPPVLGGGGEKNLVQRPLRNRVVGFDSNGGFGVLSPGAVSG